MITKEQISSSIEIGKGVLEAEAQTLIEIADRLDHNLSKAVDIIRNHTGKVVVTGMGKSGHVAQKITSTLCSTGTPAVFLHPSEAVHGDLGIYNPGDPTIVLSKSGTTAEIIRLIPILRQFNSPIIAIVSNKNSPIAQKADVALDVGISREADPLGIVPTSSALASMAMGDALASALMHIRGFKEKDFVRLHPAGQLGRNLLYTVGEVMHKREKVAFVSKDARLVEVVQALTEKPLGAACILGKEGDLKGIITDGDVRRALLMNGDPKELTAEEFMTSNPEHVEPQMMLADAIRIMEDRPSQISVLPVVNASSKDFLGLIRIHDVYQPHA